MHKNLIVESDGADTVFTRIYDVTSGLPWPETIAERVHRNRFTDEWSGREDELVQRREELSREGHFGLRAPDPLTDELPYGQGAGAVDAVRPAAEVLERICGEAREILQTRPTALLG